MVGPLRKAYSQWKHAAWGGRRISKKKIDQHYMNDPQKNGYTGGVIQILISFSILPSAGQPPALTRWRSVLQRGQAELWEGSREDEERDRRVLGQVILYFRTLSDSVRSLPRLVSNWMSEWPSPVVETWLVWLLLLKVPKQNLWILLLLLMLVFRKTLTPGWGQTTAWHQHNICFSQLGNSL